jgi:hypothetical protein
MMPDCQNCGIEIPEHEKLKFIGYCSECIPMKRREIKKNLAFMSLIGIFLTVVGVLGVYFIVEELLVLFSIVTTEDEFIGFVMITIIASVIACGVAIISLYGIAFLQGSILGFKNLKSV